jgi:UDP-glucose 4-epimerase
MPVIKGKHILVTGGAGFIGSHLVDNLITAGAGRVVVVDNFFLGKEENLVKSINNIILYRDDAADLGSMNAIVKNEKIEVVYNLATIALNYSFFNPYTAYMVNVNIADTLLRLLKENAYKTLMHVSSSEAYGTALYSPMDEKHPLNPTTPYAAGKAAADLMIQSFYNVEPLDISIIRPFNNYGPRQNIDGHLAAIIPATARRIRNGEQPIIEGDGNQTRDFVYVSDTVRALLIAYEKEESRRKVINIGTGIELSIKALIKEICKYYGYRNSIDCRPARPADVMRLCASSELANDILCFTPDINFETGIKLTLDWYEENEKAKEYI